MFHIYYLYIAFLVLAVLGTAIWFWTRRVRFPSLSLALLEIKIPRATEDNKKEIIQAVAPSEQLFNTLLAIKEPFSFEVAVHHAGEEIHFYLAVPRTHADFASRQVQGLFPDAQIKPVPDYNIFAPDGGFAGGYLTLEQSSILPLRTYVEAQVDTFAPIISTLSKLAEVGEGASVQFLVRPTPQGTKQHSLSAIGKLKKGEKMNDVLKHTLLSLSGVKKALGASDKDKEKELGKVTDDEGIKALQSKINKPLLEVSIRVVAAASERNRAEDILLAIGATFRQFHAPLRNQLLLVKPRNLRSLLFQYSFREFDPHHALILNSEELASLFHLPIFTTDVPRIKWLTGKESAPPGNLPSQGIILGESVFREDRKLVRLTRDDRRRHLYVIGQTGTGKSALMQNMVVQDMQNGDGVCVIDPHGELVEDILSIVPRERIDDVIYFNPGDLARPLGLNMLEYDFSRPEQKTFIVNEIQSIFNRLFSKDTMGPMFEQYMRNSLHLLMEDAVNEPATLMEVPRLFTDEAYRRRKLARIKNPTVLDFWEKEATKVTGEASLANMSPYITTKFGNFISNDYMRPIIGQPKSSFDFRKVMDEGKILLVNLAKGRIGDINAGLLGMIITGRILMAALARGDVSKENRKDFYFYIDEFQNFTTDSIATILSEARKYKLNLVLAHQFIAQLEDNIREAVFGNVGSLLSFRVGTPDTETLVKQFAPEFSEKDLINIENRNLVAKLLINGEPSKPFSMRTQTLAKGNAEVREKLKELSRLVYGEESVVIEQAIYNRLRK